MYFILNRYNNNLHLELICKGVYGGRVQVALSDHIWIKLLFVCFSLTKVP